jgi:hypothetical protein
VGEGWLLSMRLKGWQVQQLFDLLRGFATLRENVRLLGFWRKEEGSRRGRRDSQRVLCVGGSGKGPRGWVAGTSSPPILSLSKGWVSPSGDRVHCFSI